jgi:hypothetical protein
MGQVSTAATPAQPQPPQRYEYASCQRITRAGNNPDDAIVRFYGLRTPAVVKRTWFDAAISGLGWAGWRLVSDDQRGGLLWFLRPILRGRRIDDVDLGEVPAPSPQQRPTGFRTSP